MRALWMVAAVIGVGVLIFAHSTVIGVLIGLVFVGLAAYLYRRPLTTAGLSHR